MKIKNINKIDSIAAKAHRVQKKILAGKDDGCANFVMRHFEMGTGGHGFLHRHDWEHGIFVLRGRAKLTVDGEEQQVGQGDAFVIPSGKLHTMANAGDEPFVFICTIPAYAREEERVFVNQETAVS